MGGCIRTSCRCPQAGRKEETSCSGEMSPRIFISYRRDDAGKSTWRLYDWLERQFGAGNVFFDREAITPGAQFPRVLDERLAASDVLIAVVGTRWAGIAGASGRLRLFEAGDYVAHELASALAAGHKVIPVLVDGATMPPEADLPPRLRAFSTCSAQALDDAHFRADFEVLVDAILGRRRGFVRRRRDDVQRLVRFLKRTSALAPAAALAALFAAWLGLFGLLGLDSRFGSYRLAVGEQLTPLALENRVLIVALDDATERRMGRKYDARDPFWRRAHAVLTGRLIEAGAATVVLDFFFERESDADEQLAEALRQARQRGGRVVLAARNIDSGTPRIAPALLRAGAQWGVACLGHQQGYLFSVPLARVVDGERAANPVLVRDNEPAELPALAMVAAFGGRPDLIRVAAREITLQAARVSLPVAFSALTRGAHSACPAQADDDVLASRLMLLSPLAYWRKSAQRNSYAQWVDPAFTPPPGSLRDKVVIVGLTADSTLDVHTVRRGFSVEHRFGVELQADALRNLLSGFALRPLKPLAQYLVMLAMSLLGATACFVTIGWQRWRRIAAIVAMLALYLTLDMALLALAGVVLNPLYDITAFWLVFVLLGRLERKATYLPLPENAA
jgi:CHASE2 domain-containing sensor protein